MNSRKSDKTDQELWSEFTHGNADALGLIAERYQWILAANLFQFAKKEAEVEDLVSEVFVWVLENQARLATCQIRNLSAFLTEIGKKMYFSKKRNASRRKELLEARIIPAIPTVSRPVGQEEAYVQDLLETIQHVKNPYRRKILFLLVQGFDASEIAEQLDKPPKWVHQNVYLARRELRQMIARHQV